MSFNCFVILFASECSVYAACVDTLQTLSLSSGSMFDSIHSPQSRSDIDWIR